MMRALSLWEPWAFLWGVLGAKRNETRSWATRYRGPIAVHAAKRWTADEREICRQAPFQRRFLADLARRQPHLNLPDLQAQLPDYLEQLPRGAFIGVVLLTDCVPIEQAVETVGWEESCFGNYAPGRFAWETDGRGPWVLSEPLPVRGRQGLWTLDEATEAEIRRRLVRRPAIAGRAS